MIGNARSWCRGVNAKSTGEANCGEKESNGKVVEVEKEVCVNEVRRQG